jgi:hypothetical protein
LPAVKTRPLASSHVEGSSMGSSTALCYNAGQSCCAVERAYVHRAICTIASSSPLVQMKAQARRSAR